MLHQALWAHRREPFGQQDGVWPKEWRQLARTVFVLDRTAHIVYRTLGSVFPNIESWQTTSNDLLISASREPVHYEIGTLRARLAEEPFHSGLLAAWRADGVEDFLAHYVGNETVADTLEHLSSGPLNTDDRNVIEFALARSLGLINGFQLANLRASAHQAHADRPLLVDGDIDFCPQPHGVGPATT